ncbi:MAG: hypothetical protein HFJ30_04925 [Clostridia bacterium]|jgi:hypothetical protein|nr:hypothetical protein [Clostridia bacterium]MCI9412931.1 hypothetical protein [Clostridia bacterium]
MRKLLSYWNQNKRKILITIAVIALVIIIIQIANAMVKEQNKKDSNNQIGKNIVANDITKPSEAVVSNDKLTEKETKENSDFIEQFVNYCNQHKIEEAYNLLTDDCKAELYPTKEIFTSNYVNQIFGEQVNYELQLWYTASNCYTYRITYNKGNLLQTGGQASTGNFLDYITLIKQNGEYKLNINKFIHKEALNKQGSNEGVEVTISSKSIYVDYEIYHMTVQNNTQKTILLNDGTNANNFSLIGTNNSTFSSDISELSVSSLTLDAQYRKAIEIKFNKMYISASKTQILQMNNVYLDKQQYDTKQEEPQKITIKINL